VAETAAASTDASVANAVTTGPPARAVLRLALPTVGAMLLQSVVNEVDILFFGRLPQPESSHAQAALLPSLIFIWMFGGSLSAISVGTQAYAARRFAEKRLDDAGAVLLNAAAFAVGAGTLFTALGYLAVDPVTDAIIKVPEVREAARGYLRWRLLGILSMAATFALKAFFDGIGRTGVHFVASIVMNVMNVVLCWLLIFGTPSLGIPHLGMEGAGIAGFASTYLGLLVMLVYALRRDCRARYHPFALRKLSRSLSWDIVRLSIPSGIATIVVMTGFLLFSAIASMLDDLARAGGGAEPVASAATTVIVGVLKLTFTACLAFGTATATLVSQALGEKDGAKAERFGWTSVRLGLVIFGVVGALEALFAPQILAFAQPSSVPVQEAGYLPMVLMGLTTPVIAVGMILTQALFGAGNTRFVMIAELVLHFTCLVPLAYVLGVTLGLGLPGLWASAVVYAVGLAVVMFLKFRWGDWKAIRL
jgi:putative MATE family efflux protein